MAKLKQKTDEPQSTPLTFDENGVPLNMTMEEFNARMEKAWRDLPALMLIHHEKHPSRYARRVVRAKIDARIRDKEFKKSLREYYKLHSNRQTRHLAKEAWPKCGARCRTGEPCKMRVEWGKKRCRLHGGLSTGPRTTEGRCRIALSNNCRAVEARRRKESEKESQTD